MVCTCGHSATRIDVWALWHALMCGHSVTHLVPEINHILQVQQFLHWSLQDCQQTETVHNYKIMLINTTNIVCRLIFNTSNKCFGVLYFYKLFLYIKFMCKTYQQYVKMKIWYIHTYILIHDIYTCICVCEHACTHIYLHQQVISFDAAVTLKLQLEFIFHVGRFGWTSTTQRSVVTLCTNSCNIKEIFAFCVFGMAFKCRLLFYRELTGWSLCWNCSLFPVGWALSFKVIFILISYFISVKKSVSIMKIGKTFIITFYILSIKIRWVVLLFLLKCKSPHCFCVRHFVLLHFKLAKKVGDISRIFYKYVCYRFVFWIRLLRTD